MHNINYNFDKINNSHQLIVYYCQILILILWFIINYEILDLIVCYYLVL